MAVGMNQRFKTYQMRSCLGLYCRYLDLWQVKTWICWLLQFCRHRPGLFIFQSWPFGQARWNLIWKIVINHFQWSVEAIFLFQYDDKKRLTWWRTVEMLAIKVIMEGSEWRSSDFPYKNYSSEVILAS